MFHYEHIILNYQNILFIYGMVLEKPGLNLLTPFSTRLHYIIFYRYFAIANILRFYLAIIKYIIFEGYAVLKTYHYLYSM